MLRPLVAIDLVAGRATLAGTTVLVRARSGGALEFEGRVIHPLRFGERWRLLEATTVSGSLGANVLAAATDGDGTEDAVAVRDAGTRGDTAAQVLALHLAGARVDRTAPGCAAQVAALIDKGWTARDVLDADADVIDLITADLRADADRDMGSDGWTRIELAPTDTDDADTPGTPATTVTELVRMLERQLLERIAPVELTAGDDDSAPTARRAAVDGEPADPANGKATAATNGGANGVQGAAPGGVVSPARTRGSAGRDGVSHTTVPQESSTAGVEQLPAHPQPIRTGWSGEPGWATPTLASATGTASVLTFPNIRDVGAPVLASSAPRAVAPPPSAPSLVPRAGARAAVIEPDAAVSRTAPFAAPAADRVAATSVEAFAVADELAALLDEESDLRGLRR